MKRDNIKQFGAVSLYVVIFSVLLITIITVGFIAIMIVNQKQSTNNDLSQSAYDSALVGVEDGKRAILRYINCINDPSLTNCTEIIKDMEETVTPQTCTSVVKDLLGVTINANGEVEVKSGGDNNFEQAYTCVKITFNTSEYKGILERNDSKLIPLVGKSEFSKVKIDWFMQSDLSSGTVAGIPNIAAGKLFKSSWKDASNQDTPSVMRTQLIQYNGVTGFNLSNFNNNIDSNSSNTLFLYPTNSVSAEYSFNTDIRMQPDDILKQASCKSDFTNGGYACTSTIGLINAVGGNVKNSYLNLTSLYNKTNYQITLLDSSDNVVNFVGVQPEIDSTGRANDLFRRVKSRVEISSDPNLLPKAAVDITEKFCKDYIFYPADIPTKHC